MYLCLFFSEQEKIKRNSREKGDFGQSNLTRCGSATPLSGMKTSSLGAFAQVLFFSSSSLSLSLYLPKYKSISFTSFSICSTSVKQKPMCVIGGKETPAGGGDRDLLLTLWRHQKVTDMKSIHPDSFISFFETRVYIGNHQQQHKFRIVSFFCRPVASLPTKKKIQFQGGVPTEKGIKKNVGVKSLGH